MFKLGQKGTLILLIAVGSVFGFWLYRKFRVAPDIAIVQLPLENLDGTTINMNQFEGKALFVNYWATWCPDCLREMPSIESAYRQSDTNSVVFLMVSDEPAGKIERYLSQHNYPMKFVRNGKRMQEIGINTLPTTYLYDKNKTEVFNKVGAATWDDPAMLTFIQNVVEK